MNETFLPLPEACRLAMDAIEADPLELPQEVLEHLRTCPACREARVHYLAQEDAPQPLVPADYFQQLPQRIRRKLPVRSKASRRHLPILWLAAALLLAAASLSGFLAGRANRTPMVEASLPATTTPDKSDIVPVAPFHTEDDLLSEISDLSPEETEALAASLADKAK